MRQVSVDEEDDGGGLEGPSRGSELRLAWLWVEGWRARVRRSGDVVEMNRWEGRFDWMAVENNVPAIVAGIPGVLKGVKRGRRKSVRWA